MNDIGQMPWLQGARDKVQARLGAGRLAHALMVTGEAGVGKRAWADHVAHLLVCENSQGAQTGAKPAPCGVCRQCQLVASESHPDIRVYTPENKSRVIRISQIRDLSAFAVGSPRVAARKVVIVDRADQLNINAANGLLKTLEEPPEDLVLLLLQEGGRPVLPTIRSRCQTLTIPLPDEKQGLAWLQASVANMESSGANVSEEHCRKALRLAGGAPHLALTYLQDDYLAARDAALDHFRRFMKFQLTVTEAAKPFKALGHEESIRLFEGWAADLARLSARGEARDLDAADMLGYLAARNPAWRAHDLLRMIHESRSAGVYNVSPELEAQRLLIAWQAMMPQRKPATDVAR